MHTQRATKSQSSQPSKSRCRHSQLATTRMLSRKPDRCVHRTRDPAHISPVPESTPIPHPSSIEAKALRRTPVNRQTPPVRGFFTQGCRAGVGRETVHARHEAKTATLRRRPPPKPIVRRRGVLGVCGVECCARCADSLLSEPAGQLRKQRNPARPRFHGGPEGMVGGDDRVQVCGADPKRGGCTPSCRTNRSTLMTRRALGLWNTQFCHGLFTPCPRLLCATLSKPALLTPRPPFDCPSGCGFPHQRQLPEVCKLQRRNLRSRSPQVDTDELHSATNTPFRPVGAAREASTFHNCAHLPTRPTPPWTTRSSSR